MNVSTEGMDKGTTGSEAVGDLFPAGVAVDDLGREGKELQCAANGSWWTGKSVYLGLPDMVR